MAGLLLCIIAIVIGFSYPEDAKPEVFSTLATLAALVSFAAVCAMMGMLASLRLKSSLGGGVSRHRAAMVFARLRSLSWLTVLGLYAAIIRLFDYPYLIRGEDHLGLGGSLLLDEILVLLPFFLFASCNLAGLFMGDRLLRGSSWKMWQFQSFYLRQFLVPVFPFLIFSTAYDLLVAIPGAEENLYVYPPLLTAAYAVFILALFSFAPLLFRLLWKVERLPDGPLRTRVEAMAAASAVAYRDIYIWRTGGSNIANAMVTGVFGRMRYIFVTDALLALLPEDEVLAVLAHEMGHAKYRHMQIYLLLAISFIAFINTVDQQIGAVLVFVGENLSISMEVLFVMYAFGLLILFWGVIFGFTSRRLEQAADAFAAQKVSPQIFGSALSRIGFLSGGPRAMSSWRHYSIDKRVQFMEDTAAGRSSDVFRRSLKAAFLVVGAVVLLGAGAFVYQIFSTLNTQSRYERRFLYAWHSKEYQKAVALAEEAISGSPDWAQGYSLRAGALDELGRLEEAESSLLKAVELDPDEKKYHKQLKLLRNKMEQERSRNGTLPGDGDTSAE